ncbi:MAG: glycerol-3-phosphate dehydrogenase C-terminal domain-containing protein, partial [Rhizobium sp.]
RLFGSDLYEAEVRYLIEHEWARHAEDVLWRRTKDGLRLSKEQVRSLEEYMAAIPAQMAG